MGELRKLGNVWWIRYYRNGRPLIGVPMNVETRILHARSKLAAFDHLFSQYQGELEFPDKAMHGLSLLMQDIDADLEPLHRVPATIGAWEPREDAEGGA
jgi:hypothetical protein